MKGSTLKITIPNTNISLIKFKSSEEEYETLYSKFGITYINVIGHCQINSFNGFENPQIKIEDYEISKKMDYYF